MVIFIIWTGYTVCPQQSFHYILEQGIPRARLQPLGTTNVCITFHNNQIFLFIYVYLGYINGEQPSEELHATVTKK